MSKFGILVDLIGYIVARASLPFLSLGRIHVEPFNALPQRLSWPGYRRDENGRVEVRQAVAGWVGLGICVIMLVAVGLFIHALS